MVFSLFSFWPNPCHMKTPRPGINSKSKVWHTPQLQQCQVLSPLCHRGTRFSWWFQFAFLCWLVMMITFSLYLLAILISSLKKCLFRSFAYFFIGSFDFMLLSYTSTLYILCIDLNYTLICKYFVLLHRLPFHFVNCFFCYSIAFEFDIFLLVYFLLCCLCLWYNCQDHEFEVMMCIASCFALVSLDCLR